MPKPIGIVLRTSALIVRYAGFAVIATLANLGAQRLVLLASDNAFLSAMLTRTGVGLAAKYLLDKKWIFFDGFRSMKNEARRFAEYTATGIMTTAIFWGTESAFWLIWQTHPMRELGAVIGLTIGYVIKLNLDRHYVFRKPAGVARPSQAANTNSAAATSRIAGCGPSRSTKRSGE